ncbi:hypothetical protein K493DRAFT_310876 [Basidiobolus meristosporus CBS 931.73]|uniref:Membrane anchor Opy2 N-terminal domain-containing protein n=1 Tax=Basidiobolus meristosporus CBS 931.73 TaxID=1314790 RepID=A0A1Y1Z5V2_9FUNG|nr:hypothetical protein K493DRAFT_310876 [Basidiobolus meristosporus CBS 931.73]|eukprot:ORY05620.1 hypothetical protein K493DRAFT_310876 [Basidiobolus meristosporus CBS 931.73]
MARRTAYISWLLVLLVALANIQIVQGANPVSFCKCVCGTNVTIVELNEGTSKTCLDCTKAFCLTRDSHFCSGAGNGADLLAICFQRDSYKDQVVIYVFLIITGGLLLAALVKPYWAKWQRSRSTYSSRPN